MTSNQPPILPVRVLAHEDRTALVADEGALSYRELIASARTVAGGLLDGRADLAGARVAFLVEPGLDYVRMLLGTWLAGGIAVPLCPAHPAPELAYVLKDSAAELAVGGGTLADGLAEVAAGARVDFRFVDELIQAGRNEHESRGPGGSGLRQLSPADGAMILYTSGTTSQPKGVLSTHAAIAQQVDSLITAWGWSVDDSIALVLPLHHLHGIVNVLGCSLGSGATCHIRPRFDAAECWEMMARDLLTIFMAVPTIYSRLVKTWDEAAPEVQVRWSAGARQLRLCVSGSAALPVSVLERWREITGQTLLERYGMTETGMILSNPLLGERLAGRVGTPVPGMNVRLVDDDGRECDFDLGRAEGEIEVQGAAVFKEYWRRPEATREAFREGWFRTGDRAEFDGQSYRILGRTSVDILKSGGYKISALEIEEVLREHPGVADCSVVGLPDETWGETICAALVESEVGIELAELASWSRSRIAPYKIPRRFLVVPSLPRNVLGKVTKNAVRSLFEGQG